MTVVIWPDLGPHLGVGHLMRCIALAEEMVARDEPVVFLVDAGAVPFAATQLASRGLASLAPPPGLEEQLAALAALEPAAVVLDSYLLPPGAYATVRRRWPTLALVDGDVRGREADLYLDQNIGAEDDRWPLPVADARRLGGLSYALMRDDVLRHRPDRPVGPDVTPGAPPRVLAFFGGTDAYGAAPVVVSSLVATGLPFHLQVVAATDERRRELVTLAPGAGQQVEVIEPTDRIAELVSGADLVVSAAGTSSWELSCLGAAVALVCVADNQETSYDRATSAGLGVGLGRLSDVRADPRPATESLRAVLLDDAERAALRERGWSVVDGGGRRRVVDAFAEVRSRRA